ncbi:MAG: D-isomer specific 2-hydroxyacid dehydrogenase family protein [Acidimicrobiales bacterium]
MPSPAQIAVAPEGQRKWLAEAVRAGGATVVDPAAAEGLVWASTGGADDLAALLAGCPGIRWVQLPWAGIEPFVAVLDDRHVWTCGKGVYAVPVAEHALTLGLAGLRGLDGYARTASWSPPRGQNLVGAAVTILGGGAITEELLRLLAPFGCPVTVVRRHPAPMVGAVEVVGPDGLRAALPGRRLVILALALTPATMGTIGAEELAAMDDDAWLVNVARGGHVVTDDLVAALRDGVIGGAALDVTDPEPLPDGHPLWSQPNCLITPHVGNTPEMARPLLSARIADNVRRFGAGKPLVGRVDPALGY